MTILPELRSLTCGEDRQVEIDLSVTCSEIANLWLTAKEDPDQTDASALFQLSTIAGTIVMGAPNSMVAVAYIPASATKNAIPGRYYMDCRSQGATDGKINTISLAILFLIPAITKAP